MRLSTEIFMINYRFWEKKSLYSTGRKGAQIQSMMSLVMMAMGALSSIQQPVSSIFLHCHQHIVLNDESL